jgi:hypothetical protein
MTMDESLSKICANCWETLDVPLGKSGGLRAVAWMNHCDACAEGVADQMTLVEDQPGRARV